MEEAIFYGIMEVVERDSFLLTWYAQLPLPRLDLCSAGDLELELMVNRLQSVAGFDLHLYNSTMENGVPSVWALAKKHETKWSKPDLRGRSTSGSGAGGEKCSS